MPRSVAEAAATLVVQRVVHGDYHMHKLDLINSEIVCRHDFRVKEERGAFFHRF